MVILSLDNGWGSDVMLRTGIVLLALAVAMPAGAREIVAYRGEAAPGAIVIKTKERRLYLVQGDGTAIRYQVAVGKASKQWLGEVLVEGKHVEPAWSPPDEIKRDNPKLPDVIPGGSPRNPMGARALTLSGGGQYAIHGTNRPDSIGTFASYGCFRMFNDDIVDLFDRVSVGTPVLVLR
ncbi:L,D-transpeptidase-like protein [Bosea psychrotolerans]|uniref:L,D-transpeptidase-like protein n=2 Tax=Bosea psychrotolerans TaxID=1871628 RepID=A0A2S4MAY1_9HYPH|nr:L,D-transpeptidase-like protein [Bosea psychrotolerans]